MKTFVSICFLFLLKVCFLFKKTKLEDHHGYKTLQDFLDHSEYAEKSIQKYESVRGEGYVTIGGAQLSRELTQRFNLTSSQRLLNFGSATGGSSFQLAEVNLHHSIKRQKNRKQTFFF